jgi:hypothetical protein
VWTSCNSEQDINDSKNASANTVRAIGVNGDRMFKGSKHMDQRNNDAARRYPALIQRRQIVARLP